MTTESIARRFKRSQRSFQKGPGGNPGSARPALAKAKGSGPRRGRTWPDHETNMNAGRASVQQWCRPAAAQPCQSVGLTHASQASRRSSHCALRAAIAASRVSALPASAAITGKICTAQNHQAGGARCSACRCGQPADPRARHRGRRNRLRSVRDCRRGLYCR